MENRQCPVCGQPMAYKTGTSKKTGNPFAGYFCSDRTCTAEPQWVKLKQATAQRGQISPNQALTNTLTDINNRLKKLELMITKIGKMMKSQLPEAPDDAQIPTGEPPIPVVEEHGEKPDYPF